MLLHQVSPDGLMDVDLDNAQDIWFENSTVDNDKQHSGKNNDKDW